MTPKPAATLKSLRAALAVADHGSTAAAARVLHLSQPAAARAVQQLESALGIPLFERVRAGMQATEAGHRVAVRTRRVLAHLAQADAGPWRTAVGHGRLAQLATGRQLEVLVALASHASERRAAEVLGISQPAVHQALRQLEHFAGQALFDRLVLGLRPTGKGAWVIAHAKLALGELRAMADDLAASQGRLQGKVAIGTLPYSAGLVVPRALQAMLALHPAIQVTVVDGTYASLLEQLRQADIDVLVGALRPQAPPGMAQHMLFEDPLAVMVRGGHPLLARKLRRLRDLQDAAWILPMPGAPAYLALRHAFEAEGVDMPTGVSINSPPVIQAMLLEGDRLALMSPRQFAREIEAGLLAVLPVPLRHPPRAVGFMVRQDLLPAPALRAFIDVMAGGR